MTLIVQKFGGTSVGSIERIQHCAQLVKREVDADHFVVVAVSAMAGETNRLLALADAIDPASSPRERDMLASTGEQVSIALLSMALHKIGIDAISLTGPQAGIVTDGAFMKARIRSINTDRINQYLNQKKVVCVAGFQGLSENSDEVTTLGRGASDTTAVALAAALKAERCDIYTDVDGVYAADPRIVPTVKKIPRLSYEEMLEMASVGAKVLHTRSVQFAAKYEVPVQVRSSFEDLPGTFITKEIEAMEQTVVSAIVHNTNEAKVTLSGLIDRPGMAFKVFDLLSSRNINVDMIVQNVGQEGLADLSFTIEKSDLPRINELRQELLEVTQAKDILIDKHIAKISAIGVGMKNHAGVASRMFKVLADRQINILMISTSEIKISCVIKDEYNELAVRALCDEFELTEPSTDQ